MTTAIVFVVCGVALGALCVVQALVILAPYFGARMPRCAR